jgi:hypothetical protein
VTLLSQSHSTTDLNNTSLFSLRTDQDSLVSDDVTSHSLGSSMSDTDFTGFFPANSEGAATANRVDESISKMKYQSLLFKHKLLQADYDDVSLKLQDRAQEQEKELSSLRSQNES